MIHAKKSLGQNFLKSKAIIADIVNASNVNSEDMILEIGPGKGVLTEGLLEKAKKVIAIEKDDRLIEHLNERFAEEISKGNFELLHADILDLKTESLKLVASSYKVVANIPYYITGQILRQFLESDCPPSQMTLMVQKEVSDRIVARDKKESLLSISVKLFGTPRYIKKVPARYFSPEPKVDSAILNIENISSPFKSKEDIKIFFEILKTGFAHKRKVLISNLSDKYSREKIAEVFRECGLDEKIRAENLTINDWKKLESKL